MMKNRISYYVSRKNVLVWLAALVMVCSAIARIAYFCGKGADAATVWFQIVLPVAASLIYVLILLCSGEERLYRTAVPVFMAAIYFGIRISSMDGMWRRYILLCWIAYMAFAVAYAVIISGKGGVWLLPLMYLAALGVLENGARRREDARRFASFCAASGVGGISALVRAIDAAALAGSTGQDTTPGGARPGCVTVMTIHRSKGLQFPVVFVGDKARKFNASDIRQPVLVHRSYGAGLRLRPENGEGAYKTAAYTALANVHARELRSEQMRLLYVALTRAQDKLILTVPLSSGKSAKPFAKAAAFLAAGAGATLHQQANSFADWLRAALLVHPDGGVLRQLSCNRELLFVQTESVMAIRVCDDAVQLSEEIDTDTPDETPETDPALVETLRQNFAWQYPAAALAQVPAKVSVTSIVHKAEQTTLERPGFLSKDGLTAAEMGTALHAFLEHADFARLAAAKAAGTLDEAIPAERDRQVALQLTAPEIAEKLDAVCIHRFVESEAFAKICAAEQVLRELPFITALPADAVLAAQGHEELPAAADAQVLVQGIADLVLVYPDHLELLDYKTDRRKAESDFLRAYRAQLNLYAIAIEKRFAPKKVTYKGIYSFALGKLIEA